MACKSKESEKLLATITFGMPRIEVITLLQNSKHEYSIESQPMRNQRKGGHSSDSEFVESECVIWTIPYRNNEGLIRSTEILTIGFDKADKVEKVDCKTYLTGP